MKANDRVLKLFDGLVDRILCVVGAILFSQGPEFMQQYLQRLGGHLQEAQRQLTLFREAATHSGRTLEQFITQTQSNPDNGVVQLGSVMRDSLDRTASLQAAHDALIDASLWTRPFIFMRHVDLSIAQSTWSVYRPAVPTTPEGLVYAAVGMLVALTLYYFGTKCLGLILHRKSSPAGVPA